jgi:hypothetical protein
MKDEEKKPRIIDMIERKSVDRVTRADRVFWAGNFDGTGFSVHLDTTKKETKKKNENER